MRPEMTPDETLLRQLPLPLAQLYRRAHNAKTALERHLAAFYLWEASLKLLASVAVVAYAERGPADPQLAEPLHNLARPALGHWWEFARLLVPALAEREDEPFQKTRALLLGKPRDDCPRAAGLDALLREALEGKAGARATVQFGELFARLLTFRNAELGHGAAGQRPGDFYERMGPALLAGLAEVLARLDVLAGRRLIHVADVRRLASGNWLVERYELHGEAARRLESLEVPEADAARLPRPGRLYLHAAAADAAGQALHPLVVYDAETVRTFFLNSRRGERRADYLCYTTGEVVRRDELGGEQRELLARVLGGQVDGDALQDWPKGSQAEEPPASEPTAGRRTIGEYELLSELGRGGMGVVYRAWQPSLGRQVALKCLRPSGDRKTEDRFAREIRALGRVEHPNLVKVFTSGAVGERWFYAMELMEGADLAAVCAELASSTAAEVGEDQWIEAVRTACEKQRTLEKPLGGDGPREEVPNPHVTVPHTTADRQAGRGHVDQVVEIVRQVAEAAHALHEAGVVHRDIKPGNILLTPERDRAVLTDLGLAQLMDETDGRLTRTREFVGTLRYASPEQVDAVGRLDRRSDVYSLGATLWELLTLRPLFGATEPMPTAEIIHRIQRTDPERPRKYNPRVPRDLEAIVFKCLEKDRARRYATAAGLAADLGRWRRGDPVHAQPPSLLYLLIKMARRYPVATGVLLAAAAGVVIALILINHARQQAEEAKSQALASLRTAQVKEKEAQDALAREQKALADLKAQFSAVAHGFFDRGDLEFRIGREADSLNSMLRAYEVAPPDDALRPSYRHLLAAQARSLGWRPLLHGDAVTAVAFSPDGRTVLTSSFDTTARQWDAATGKPHKKPLSHGDKVMAVAFSPDGGTVLTGSMDKTARLWDAQTDEQRAILDHGGPVLALAFSPDGRIVLTGSADGTARLWDAAFGKPLGEPLSHGGAVTAVAFSPDGRTVLTGSFDRTARLWDAASGKPRAVLHHDKEVLALAYSPDGRIVLTGSADGTARLWHAASGERFAELPHDNEVIGVAFSPDGRTVLTGSKDHTARLWDAASGKPLGEPLHHDGQVMAVAFSPDGRTALTGSIDKTARLWDASSGKPLGQPLSHAGDVRALAFSPDGHTFLTGSWDRTARLWDFTTGEPLAAFPHGGTVEAVALSPDGGTVLTGSLDRTARLWDADTGKQLAVLLHESAVRAVAFSPDGRAVLTGSDDNTARLWNAKSGEERRKFPHRGPVVAVAFSPDGRTVLTVSEDKKVRWWDAETGVKLRQSSLNNTPYILVMTAAFSRDGHTVLTGGWDSWARLWDAETGEERRALEHRGRVMGEAFSPDGQRVLTGNEDMTARLWDAATGDPRDLLQHTTAVNAVAFSPSDDSTVLTGSWDNMARLWDLTTGKQVVGLRHRGPVHAVAFSSDGQRVLTGSEDKTACVWNVDVRPAPDDRWLGTWVAVRTGKAFDDRGALQELTRDIWLQRWQELEANGGDGEPPPDGRRWHRIQAAEAEASGQWFAAEFHLEWLRKNGPNDVDLQRRLRTARERLRPPDRRSKE